MINKLRTLVIKKPEILIYIYFGLMATAMAFMIRKGTPPDETFHYDSIKYYASHGISPILDRQDSAFHLGDIARESSYLYHYLLSFPYRLLQLFNVEPFFVIRVVNVILSIVTLIVLNAIAINLALIKSLRLTLLFLVSNIPIFILISSAINYDNSIILLSSIGFLICIKLTKKYSIKLVSALLIISVYGPLMKYSFLPLTAGFVTFCGFITFKSYKKAFSKLKVFKKENPILLASLLIVIVIGSSLFAERYLANIYRYHNIRPSCNQVLTHEQCLNNGIYSRSDRFKQRTSKKPMNNDLDTYITQWSRIMVSRTYGLLAHKNFDPTPVVINMSIILFYALLIYFFRHFWTSSKTKIYVFVPLISSFYLSCLLLTNLSAYRRSGIITLAVQGRYWLPVFLPFIFYVFYLGKLNDPKRMLPRRILIVFLICFSLLSGVPNILKGIDSNWLNESATVIIDNIKEY